jgi:CRISPR-associated protein Csy1
LVQRIRSAIDGYIQTRLQEKLEAKRGASPEEQASIQAQFESQTWLADAARRVAQVQQASHVLKFTHPDARGTSLDSAGNAAAGDLLIGSHSVADAGPRDVVGNAAALDVAKFLAIEVDGQPLYRRAAAADPNLRAALGADADGQMAAFATYSQPKDGAATHTLAKQLYWPLPDGDYHLLAPLFPSALAHGVWSRIQQDRFSDQAKAARKAAREEQPHQHGYCEYPDMAIPHFGGTKPQNISLLNSQRRGEVYLLAALPPNWHDGPQRPPLNVPSVFGPRFAGQPEVRRLLRELGRFLYAVRERPGDDGTEPRTRNNIEIRERRAAYVNDITEALLHYAARHQALAPGWSADPTCQLPTAERYWLDPGRAAQDPEFAAGRDAEDWRERIAERYGNWLNARLSRRNLRMGEDEAAAWSRVLLDAKGFLQQELKHND